MTREEQMDAILAKAKEKWLEQPDKTFMELLMNYLPEEDIFWTTDEDLVKLLDGIDPWDEDY